MCVCPVSSVPKSPRTPGLCCADLSPPSQVNRPKPVRATHPPMARESRSLGPRAVARRDEGPREGAGGRRRGTIGNSTKKILTAPNFLLGVREKSVEGAPS